MGIYKAKYGVFENIMKVFPNKEVFAFGDLHTLEKGQGFIKQLKDNGVIVHTYLINQDELIPTELLAKNIIQLVKKADYILGIGSGSINDLGKYISYHKGLPYGVFPTAPSMDGYLSKGSALICEGVKKTFPVHSPDDMFIDLEILKKAPEIMVGAGLGDIIGKYTSLADWKLSEIMNHEIIDEDAFDLMNHALEQVMDSFELILLKDDTGMSILIDALNSAGLAMKLCGNSRPASGSEHHISHYLEMDYIKNKRSVPLHGLKVGLGTLISLELYQNLDIDSFPKDKKEKIKELVQSLPKIRTVEMMLSRCAAPIRFSEIGVSEALFEATIKNAYKVRDRFTILTYYCQTNRIESMMELLKSKYL